MNFFGTKKPAAAPAPAQSRGKAAVPVTDEYDTIMQLKATIEQQTKREAHLRLQMQEQLKLAKAKNDKGDKKGALLHIKRKKMKEAEVNKIGGALLNLESQVMALEAAASSVAIAKSMKAGAQTLARVNKSAEITDIDEMMDDIEDEMANAQDVANALQRPIGTQIDDDEVEAELAELDDLELDGLSVQENIFTAVSTATKDDAAELSLPDVPTHKLEIPEGVTQDEEAELRALAGDFA